MLIETIASNKLSVVCCTPISNKTPVGWHERTHARETTSDYVRTKNEWMAVGRGGAKKIFLFVLRFLNLKVQLGFSRVLHNNSEMRRRHCHTRVAKNTSIVLSTSLIKLHVCEKKTEKNLQSERIFHSPQKDSANVNHDSTKTAVSTCELPMLDIVCT